MKTIFSLAVVALLAGCGSRTAGPPIALDADVRLLGTNAGAYSAVLIAVQDLTVTDGTTRLAVGPGQARIDLGDPSQAWLAGRVAIPVGVDRIHVSLTLDDFGGWQSADGTTAGDVDARSRPIVFDADVAWLVRSMATIRLDVGASLTPLRDDTLALLPSLNVAY